MKSLLPFFMLCISIAGYGQVQILDDAITAGHSQGSNGIPKSTQCGVDTNQYVFYKATGFSALNVNNATSAQAVAQYFNAPQPITISGLDFYAYKIDATGGITTSIDVDVYLAGTDSLPTGAPLASTSIVIDTNFYGGDLNSLIKSVTFTPVTVSQPYVLVVTNASANGVGMIFTDYTVQDGQQEWLTSLDLFGTWTRSYNINVGGSPMDGDFMISPYTGYNIAAAFTADNPCFSSGSTVTFTNTSSPILQDRMYSYMAMIVQPEMSFTWNFGDLSANQNSIDATHAYSTNTNHEYTVTLTDTMYGFYNMCSTDTTIVIGDSLFVDFTSTLNAGTTTFTDAVYAQNGATTYLWDFGDGNTAFSQAASNNYGAPGQYTVCLTVVTACGGVDSTCHVICGLLPDVGVTQSGVQLTADQAGVSYQWLDCDNGYAVISGETNQTYSPTATGNYAVQVTSGGCSDTSACFTVSIVGLEDLLQSDKTLVKIIDFMGRETVFRPNTPLIFIYSDGTRERVMKIEK